MFQEEIASFIWKALDYSVFHFECHLHQGAEHGKLVLRYKTFKYLCFNPQIMTNLALALITVRG